MTRYKGLIDRYRDHLPVAKDAQAITLAEGNTPLIRVSNIANQLQKPIEVFVKIEGANPTGSFKDRGMTVAVTQAVAAGANAIICASTGNTSASAAAYAARAGIQAFVIIPEGKIALGKLAQAMMYGAVVIQIKGNFDRGMELVKEIANELPLAVVNSVNPDRIQGQKTISFEVVEGLGRAPDYHCLPVGNAGNITAHWLGYNELYQAGEITRKPKMLGYQAAGAAPFMSGKPIAEPETVATAIRIGNPQSWDQAHAAQRESGGWFNKLSDAKILAAQRLLATTEGIFCEPASAASIAGLLEDKERIAPGSLVVCTLTGNGLKDPDTAIRQCTEQEVVTVTAELNPIKDVLLQHIAE